jgi:hypothetical protein
MPPVPSRAHQGSELNEPLPTFPPLYSLEIMEIPNAHRRNYTVLTASEVPLSSYSVRVPPSARTGPGPISQLQARAEIPLVCQLSHRPGTPSCL